VTKLLYFELSLVHLENKQSELKAKSRHIIALIDSLRSDFFAR